MLEKKEKELAKEKEKLMTEKAERKTNNLDKKEAELMKDEKKNDESYEPSKQMPESAEVQMSKAIEENDMVGVSIAKELMNAARKKT